MPKSFDRKGLLWGADFFSVHIYVSDEPLGISGLSSGSFPNAVAAARVSKRYPEISRPHRERLTQADRLHECLRLFRSRQRPTVLLRSAIIKQPIPTGSGNSLGRVFLVHRTRASRQTMTGGMRAPAGPTGRQKHCSKWIFHLFIVEISRAAHCMA